VRRRVARTSGAINCCRKGIYHKLEGFFIFVGDVLKFIFKKIYEIQIYTLPL